MEVELPLMILYDCLLLDRPWQDLYDPDGAEVSCSVQVSYQDSAQAYCLRRGSDEEILGANKAAMDLVAF